MSRLPTNIAQTAQFILDTGALEVEAARARQLLSVVPIRATGTGDMNEALSLDLKWRLVYLRCHFAGGTGTAPMTLSLDSSAGSAYDAKLFTLTAAGAGADVNLRIEGDDTLDPSPWTFQTGDALSIAWTNPDSGNLTWGLEVGLALTS